ncbi:MAG: helix-turn-helix transcriptional regulator [Pirellula sp.]|jgi:HTH-type transcriptional regulator, competence development regulator
MHFGARVKSLRKSKSLTQRQLATLLGVSFTYISKVENEKLHFGDFPSEKFIHKLARVLDGDESELLLLADKVPDFIRQRIRQRPEFFRAIAELDDSAIDVLHAGLLKQDS